jgi:hypothetical protein
VDQRLLDRHERFVGGRRITPSATQGFAEVSPSTEEVVGQVPLTESVA